MLSAVMKNTLLRRFARLLTKRYGARLFLFGSHARGTARPRSDDDLVAVSPAFRNLRRFDRAPDRFTLWRSAGGATIGLDLHCYTPEEFRAECASLGFLGQAKRRGELIGIPSSNEAGVPSGRSIPIARRSGLCAIRRRSRTRRADDA